MALNKFMHPRNRYKNQPPDFAKLAAKYDNFAQHVSVSLSGKVSVDFKNPQALRSLTCTLLKEDFNVEIDVPLDRLVPTLPLRLNYIHWVEDLIRDNGAYRGSHIHGIDIGTGASCIYPLLGARLNEWHITATETDPVNVFYAKENIEKNNMNDKIKVIESSEDDIFSQVFEDNERQCYDFSMCNPPFYGSLLEAQGFFSRSEKRPEPKSSSTAAEPECVVEGGEVEFVRKIILDSLKFRERI
ncbi:RNA N(6)-adenosine-methyltransferase mettl16-like, partial [Saccoglossus kowalevskii]|uniref:U6 snRNA m(6)A methyltransferase n=1 Tax=Saccoglossus kowalevskii TaxID=10224 RepID=A0ABM0H202_SACKO